MRGLLKELQKMGKTILVSSHILPELADICNKIGIIERGQLLFNGDVASAIRQVVPPCPRITAQRSLPGIVQGVSGCRRWLCVELPTWGT